MKRSTYIAAGLVVGLGVWLLTGALAARHDAKTPGTSAVGMEAAPMKVRVRDSASREVIRRIAVQGQLEPRRTLELRAETAGTVAELNVAKGQPVDAGAVLVTLAPENRPERLAEAEALLAQRKAELNAARKLGRKGLQSENALRRSEAEMAAAEAVLAAAHLDLVRMRIRAPFAGVVNERPVEQGDLVERGDVVATLVEVSRLLATAQVPQRAVGGLGIGDTVRVLPAGGEPVEGRITYVSGVADTGTRSFRIEAEVANPDRRLAAGMSATLQIPLEKVNAHFVSPALLTLGKDGEVGVMTVNESGRVVFHDVGLVRTESGGAWVSGLPEQARVITLGQGFVTEGQAVEPVDESVVEAVTRLAAENPS